MINNKFRQGLRSRTYVEVDDGRVAILEDPMAELHTCYRFMHEVLIGKYDFNLLAATKRKERAYYEKVSSLLPRISQYSRVYVPGFVYHPAIKLFFDQYRAHPIHQFSISDSPYTVLINGTTVAEVFIDFIRTLKLQAKRQQLRRKIADHDAKLAKNRKRLHQFEDELFRRCSRPVIVRIDLEYLLSRIPVEKLDCFIEEESLERFTHDRIYGSHEALDGRDLPAMRVSLAEVQRDRVKLFANMKGKPSLFRHLIAYVWRIEYGHKAGFHLHLLLAFDGAHVLKHEWLANMIGEYWVEVITEGRGRFHNCNLDWDKESVRYGLGAIEWHDDRLRGNLVNGVLPYLAKFDQYVLARPYKGCKLMGSGFVHRKKPTGRGRPRIFDRRQSPPPAPEPILGYPK